MCWLPGITCTADGPSQHQQLLPENEPTSAPTTRQQRTAPAGKEKRNWRFSCFCFNSKQCNFRWAVSKRSFISQARKELLTLPLRRHHLSSHGASLRVGIPVFCLRASLRWLTQIFHDFPCPFISDPDCLHWPLICQELLMDSKHCTRHHPCILIPELKTLSRWVKVTKVTEIWECFPFELGWYKVLVEQSRFKNAHTWNEPTSAPTRQQHTTTGMEK